MRPKLKPTDWVRRRDDTQTFVLGIVRDVSLRLHDALRSPDWETLNRQMQIELAQYQLHRGERNYIVRAIENYLNCHDISESELGPLKLRVCDPSAVPDPNIPSNQLTVWAPVYDNESGVREVRKLRFGQARPVAEDVENWAITAAHIAALFRPRGHLVRIRVIEFGLGDGSTEILFDGSPSLAESLYAAKVFPIVSKIVTSNRPTPGNSCGRCKISGCCSSLEKLDGFLGQSRKGPATRSVSAGDLEVYEKCPAQWHLVSSNMPREPSSAPPSSSSERGRVIHEWLARSHMSSHKCDPSDLDAIDGNFPAGLDEKDYLDSREYITQHAAICPLGEGVQVIGSEVSVYGYDAQADVVIVSKPDLLYVDSDETFVIRESKTTTLSLPGDSQEAFDRFFAVPWLLNLIGSGYRGPYKSDKARLELEVLASEDSRVFSWDLADARLLRMARAEVRLRAKKWHRDTTWNSAPGEHCRWCPVRGWCSDAAADEADDDQFRIP
ncbi:PD-(D/E)XK nuclease family protein [Streptomyces akebiae]|uniref:PD-(D/E)XK nuclease family protein n=1 Tax=Streptomyces akebiae TaxID=2865673 RepID=A0ABX8XVN1_9ACTN|nr:PD-(D/E)XK nuclease family protein [Streptomyces akebiae]QYX79973.1 PD-(D/E)XK nuclease family protein [Streptomyces akebiae]